MTISPTCLPDGRGEVQVKSAINSPRQCWICRAEQATTGEHKFPRAYLARIPDDWRDLVHGRWDGEHFHTQGPKSKNLNLPVLCAPCNNTRTGPQDRALDSFLLYAAELEEKLWLSCEVLLDHDPDHHSVLDLYRCLLKLEFSRLYDDGVEIAPAIADFVHGGDNWEAANGLVRVEFRAAEGFRHLSLTYPFDSEGVYYEEPYFISHQINFGWLGVHFLYAPSDRPDLPWARWQFDTAAIVPGDLDDRGVPAL